jgi:hypothetical protein
MSRFVSQEMIFRPASAKLAELTPRNADSYSPAEKRNLGEPSVLVRAWLPSSSTRRYSTLPHPRG